MTIRFRRCVVRHAENGGPFVLTELAGSVRFQPADLSTSRAVPGHATDLVDDLPTVHGGLTFSYLQRAVERARS